MRKAFFVAFTGVIIFGTMLSLQSRGAQPSYAEGLGLNTDTPTVTLQPNTATSTATPTNTTQPNTATSTATPTNTTQPNTATATATATVTTQFHTATPTATVTRGPIRFPIILRQPTFTPTATSTATKTATPTTTPTITRTPTKTATGVPGATGLTGQLARVEPNKPTYATWIENVQIYEWIFNPTGHTVNFGILGVQTTGPAPVGFQTSWDGAGAPGGVLTLNAGCHGPVGIPCSSGDGRHNDHVGDGDPDHDGDKEISTPGTYQMTLYVCYSPFSACLQPGQGDWHALTGPVSFNAINWTPSPDEIGTTPPPSFDVDDGPACFLITDDPAGIYLSCPHLQAKHRPLARHP